MSILGDNSLVRLSLAVAACVAVSMISYQQGQIQANTPKEGQYVTSLVFTTTMGSVDTKLAALKDTIDAQLKGLATAQDLRLQLVEAELRRLREDVSVLLGEKHVPVGK